MVWYCSCSDGTHLREKKHDKGAKRTVVVMLQVTTKDPWIGAIESMDRAIGGHGKTAAIDVCN